MKTLKLTVLFLFLFSSYSFADNQKHKDLPPGLQKKVQRGGDLPPGWKDKLRKGHRLDDDIYSHGVIITDRYPVISGTVVYRVDDKILRLAIATKEIIDILK